MRVCVHVSGHVSHVSAGVCVCCTCACVCACVCIACECGCERLCVSVCAYVVSACVVCVRGAYVYACVRCVRVGCVRVCACTYMVCLYYQREKTCGNSRKTHQILNFKGALQVKSKMRYKSKFNIWRCLHFKCALHGGTDFREKFPQCPFRLPCKKQTTVLTLFNFPL